MNRKGIVSFVNNLNKTVRVVIPELDNIVSGELTIAAYVAEPKVNDIVVVNFYENTNDGLVIGNLSNNTSNGNYSSTIDGGSFV